jgi:tetratricopeptide (TPR) repeat protein
LALIGLGILTLPVWGPFYAVGVGGYMAAKATKKAAKKSLNKFQEEHRNIYDFLNPDAVQVKINDLSLRLKFNKNAVFYVQRGVLYMLTGRVKDSLADFASALQESNNTNPSAHFYSAVIYYSRGNIAKAIEHSTKAIENADNVPSLTEKEQKYDNMVNTVEEWRRSFKKTSDSARLSLTNYFSVPDYLNLGDKFVQEEQFKDLLDKTLNRKINLCDMYYNRAIAHMYQYDFQSAISDFEAIMEINSNDEQANIEQYLFEYGKALYYHGDLEQASNQFTQAFVLCESDVVRAHILIMRAATCDRLHMYEDAESDRKKASELHEGVNTQPLHIKLLPEDAIHNIITFLDGRSRKNLQLTSRQIKKLTVSFSILDYTNPHIIRQNMSKVFRKVKLLSVEKMKNFLRLMCTKRPYYCKEDLNYIKFIDAWKDKKDCTAEEANELTLYMEEIYRDPFQFYNIPDQVKNMLESREQKLGEILYQSKDNFSTADIHTAVVDKGPTMIIAAVSDASISCTAESKFFYICAYTSVSWKYSGSYAYDDTAWIYYGNSKKLKPVIDASRAVNHSQFIFAFGDTNEERASSEFGSHEFGFNYYRMFYCDSKNGAYGPSENFTGRVYDVMFFKVEDE